MPHSVEVEVLTAATLEWRRLEVLAQNLPLEVGEPHRAIDHEICPF